MKKSAPWKAPLEVVGSDSIETNDHRRERRRKVLSAVAGGTGLGAFIGLFSGMLLGLLAGTITAVMGWSDSGQKIAVAVAVGATLVLGTVGGGIGPALEEREPRRYKRSPRVLSRHAAAFHALDRNLEVLAGRVSVNPDLVGSVGRGVLAARASLVEVCEQYRLTTLDDGASSDELARADAVVRAEFEKADRLLADATEALDEEERLTHEARMNPGLAADFEAKLAGSPIDALSEGVRARRGALAEVRGEVSASSAQVLSA